MATGSALSRREARSPAQTPTFMTLPAEMRYEIYFRAFDMPRTPIILRSRSHIVEASTKRNGDGIEFEYLLKPDGGWNLIRPTCRDSEFVGRPIQRS